MVFKKKSMEFEDTPIITANEVQADTPPAPTASQNKQESRKEIGLNDLLNEIQERIILLEEHQTLIATKLRLHQHTSEGKGYMPL